MDWEEPWVDFQELISVRDQITVSNIGETAGGGGGAATPSIMKIS